MNAVRVAISFSILYSSMVFITGCGEKAGIGTSSSPAPVDKTSAATETSAPPTVKSAVIALAPDEILLETLDSSDYPILADILRSADGGKPQCPGTAECENYVESEWKREISTEQARLYKDANMRKAYLSSIDGKPPHVQQQITKDAFTARYDQLKKLVESKNLCFIAPWKLQFVDNQYHFAGGNGRHTSVRTNDMIRVFPATDIYLLMGGKFFAPVPAQTMTDEVYKKFASYSERPDNEARTMLKLCGKFKGEYNRYLLSIAPPPKPVDPNGPPPAPPEMVSPTEVKSLFELTKPIEIVEPPSMKRLDTIPVEWLR